jgi:hypothetical protein
MNTATAYIAAGTDAAQRRNAPSRPARRLRRLAATTTALTFMLQNLAWAVCSDGSTFPAGGYMPATATVWSLHTFTGTLGSAWVPDISVNEHNNKQEPVTSGGHNWAFDQGSTTCKETDIGGASGPPTTWAIPPVNATDCLLLPIFKQAGNQLIAANFGDIPQKGSTLTPTCDPTLLAVPNPLGGFISNPNNTYLNQLGCALGLMNTGRIQATDAQHATTYLFTAGVKSGLFVATLSNVAVSIPGQEAGKTAGSGLNYYAQLFNIASGERLDSAIITPDGKYLLGASSRTNDAVYACRNPLGDPGDLTKPINMAAFAASTDTSLKNTAGVQCMQIGQGGDSRVKALAVGADGQPYMGGLNFISNFTNFPTCIGTGVTPVAPITDPIVQAFVSNSQNHCVATRNTFLNADPTGAAAKAETQALVSHQSTTPGVGYLYRALKGGAVYQAKVTAAGVTAPVRQFASGMTSPSGLGFDEEGTHSTMLFDDQSQLGLAGREAIYKVPVCEDMP